MTRILRAAVVAVLAASSLPAVAAAQQASTDSLLHRIDLLERRTADLEQRVRELEALIRIEPSPSPPVSASARWRDLQNWRRLRRGMSMDEVRVLLGEPERVNAGAFTFWHWDSRLGHAGPTVTFDNRGRVHGWSEPR
jgi:outer membrane protein assembly factor BamE (lipoprotein component of BamABCDE complex)